ncbi:MAG: aspartate aminotransferase family protein [Chloroflexi bacterium]|nr:aspartate aminotransferase family protein [Chloroflexota bacterium]
MPDDIYAASRPGSARLFKQALNLFPSGVTHDVRAGLPVPLYITRASGSRKWDVDGNEYVDYWMGHGALLLGHSHPHVVQAVCEQMAKGTHYGACHELELAWAGLVQRLIPSAERIRFVASGTEAVLMATRLACGYTGKRRILKFHGHFHGWQDYFTVGVIPPYDVPISVGVQPDVAASVISLPANDIALVERVLGQDGDVAAVILEPTGASYGKVPLREGFLRDLREVTARLGVLLIFDEVVTAFRISPGGAQSLYGVLPDITTLAKVLAGGLPGGAVVGRKDIMELLAFSFDGQRNRFGRIAHPGTFNANPVSAAAGVAALGIVAEGDVHHHVDRIGTILKAALNDAIARLGLPGACVYGEGSVLHFLLGSGCQRSPACDFVACNYDPDRLKMGIASKAKRPFAFAMQRHGVDLMGGHAAFISAAHSEADVDHTVQAFETTLRQLTHDGVL